MLLVADMAALDVFSKVFKKKVVSLVHETCTSCVHSTIEETVTASTDIHSSVVLIVEHIDST
jgi:hypothetical protein